MRGASRETMSASERPRMCPFIPAIVDGALSAFVIESPKQRALERASPAGASGERGQLAIHAHLRPDNEQFLASGLARRVDDLEARARVG